MIWLALIAFWAVAAVAILAMCMTSAVRDRDYWRARGADIVLGDDDDDHTTKGS